MSVDKYGPEESELLSKVFANFGKPAREQGMLQPWRIQVWDADDRVFCQGLLRDADHEVRLFDARCDEVAMFHPPYRAELTAAPPDNRRLHQPSIDHGGSWLTSTPLDGPLPAGGTPPIP